jgi:YVTN family beta-propeller protein
VRIHKSGLATLATALLSLTVCSSSSALFALSSTNIPVGNTPLYVAANTTTHRIYVTNLNDNTVSVIDGNSNTVVATVPVGNAPMGIDVNAVTNLIYVASSGSSFVSVIDGNSNKVTNNISSGSATGCRSVAVNERQISSTYRTIARAMCL